MKKTVLAVILVSLTAGLPICLSAQSGSVIDIDIDTLVQEFENNRARAKQLYQNKTIRITGAVRDISTESIYVGNYFNFIDVNLTRSELPKLANLNKGQIVTVRGVYDDNYAFLCPFIKNAVFESQAASYNKSGVDASNRGNYDRAIADFTEAIRLEPNEAVFYENRGIAYYYKKDYDRVIADLNQVLRIAPNYADLADVYALRGAAYYGKSNYTEARADADRSLRIDRNNELAKNLDADLKKAAGTQQASQTPQQNTNTQPQAQPASGTSSAPQTGTYQIGDRGPAGGIVFFDKGNNDDGWRYMEAAPFDLQKAQWGLAGGFFSSGENLGNGNTVAGYGKQHTELIIAALNKKSESGKAAQLCRAYTLNGYKDWFLPNMAALELMYKNLHQKGLGNFGGGIYWSSSFYETSTSQKVFNNTFLEKAGSSLGTSGRGESCSVRPVRYF